MSKQRIEVAGEFRVRVPHDVIAEVHLSVPALRRLVNLERLAGADAATLASELTRLGANLFAFPEIELQNQLATCRRRLASLATDPIWLLPEIVQGKFTYADHLRPFLAPHEPAAFAFGLRDTYQNRFKWALLNEGKRPLRLARPGEPLAPRMHTAIYSTGDDHSRVHIGLARSLGDAVEIFGDAREVRFAVACTPLVWDGVAVPKSVRLAYQADLRHEFHLPPSTWNSMHSRLQNILFRDAEPEEIGDAILSEAGRLGLQPETGYYLASAGVDERGDLILISAHGSADELAARQIAAGATRAVLTEEGGSCAYALWESAKDFSAPDNVRRSPDGKPIYDAGPRIFGMTTYWRESALALCVLRLREFVRESPFLEEPAQELS